MAAGDGERAGLTPLSPSPLPPVSGVTPLPPPPSPPPAPRIAMAGGGPLGVARRISSPSSAPAASRRRSSATSNFGSPGSDKVSKKGRPPRRSGTSNLAVGDELRRITRSRSKILERQRAVEAESASRLVGEMSPGGASSLVVGTDVGGGGEVGGGGSGRCGGGEACLGSSRPGSAALVGVAESGSRRSAPTSGVISSRGADSVDGEACAASFRPLRSPSAVEPGLVLRAVEAGGTLASREVVAAAAESGCGLVVRGPCEARGVGRPGGICGVCSWEE